MMAVFWVQVAEGADWVMLNLALEQIISGEKLASGRKQHRFFLFFGRGYGGPNEHWIVRANLAFKLNVICRVG